MKYGHGQIGAQAECIHKQCRCMGICARLDHVSTRREAVLLGLCHPESARSTAETSVALEFRGRMKDIRGNTIQTEHAIVNLPYVCRSEWQHGGSANDGGHVPRWNQSRCDALDTRIPTDATLRHTR
ncbi:hypothetical protein H310_05493 [Aphanomyces invadans]|uniref:Uncharacterized protein n=1 Tax=Aphanomyces invadans TaxID=157072 RepID=A0A024UA22_9STRA|nr:hypothetical protein H310_05493 [Aphanomyces invadans]ETW03065.1 hypothetical protein H310_05493 [Aphanomyces invadans]|eukprot:XP_008868449.1 hypothetical protein H310_05493 [Aphanomyces invadans]